MIFHKIITQLTSGHYFGLAVHYVNNAASRRHCSGARTGHREEQEEGQKEEQKEKPKFCSMCNSLGQLVEFGQGQTARHCQSV